MKFRSIASPLIFLACLLTFPWLTAAEKNSAGVSETTAESIPTPKPTATQTKVPQNQNFGKALVIHKPMPSPSWGKVVQYHQEQILALSEKNRETLHEFVFQDENGIVRTAVFHENASGDGYWEVWVWDQP